MEPLTESTKHPHGEIFLHNTLSGAKEIFIPLIPEKVTMYHCGPTVYNFAHIGNMRAYVFADILRRTFEYNGYAVHQVMNITDIGHLTSDSDEGDDKMTTALRKAGKPLTLEALKEHADFYTERFIEDLHALNTELPQELPKASEHIEGDIELIKILEEKGFVYVIGDGVYFDTSKDLDYGKLGNIKAAADDSEQSRIGLNSEKRNPRDFCVWKLDQVVGWESPWGKGFPGWHIECSVMSMKYLGETFDIHTGGIDHIPVHHNNEIAQSESATGKPLAHYWLHGAFVNIDGAKIAKSVGNTLYINNLQEKMGISPLGYRYWLLTAHYRTLVNFTEESVKGAETAYNRLRAAVREIADTAGVTSSEALMKPSSGEKSSAYGDAFVDAVNDDLNTARALALTWELMKDQTLSPLSKLLTIIDFDRVFGLRLSEEIGKKSLGTALPHSEIPEDILKIISDRELARKDKDWKVADALRQTLNARGYDITDINGVSEVTRLL